MIKDLLDAECVIKHLKSLELIGLSYWQDSNPVDHDYSYFFENKKGTGDLCMQIIKRKEKYYISRSIITILSHRHNFNPVVIFEECNIVIS